MYSSIAEIRSGTLVKVPRRMRLRVISSNQRSIRLSQELLVGVKVHRVYHKRRQGAPSQTPPPVPTGTQFEYLCGSQFASSVPTIRRTLEDMYSFRPLRSCDWYPRFSAHLLALWIGYVRSSQQLAFRR